jgi:hypothetical protein
MMGRGRVRRRVDVLMMTHGCQEHVPSGEEGDGRVIAMKKPLSSPHFDGILPRYGSAADERVLASTVDNFCGSGRRACLIQLKQALRDFWSMCGAAPEPAVLEAAPRRSTLLFFYDSQVITDGDASQIKVYVLPLAPSNHT